MVKVRGLVFVGTRTDAFDETCDFFRDVLGIAVERRSAHFGWARLADRSIVELFGPGDRHHAGFTTGPVPEFLVDDVAAALEELRAAGVEIVGEPYLGETEGWLQFRAPDGNVYGLTSGPQYEA